MQPAANTAIEDAQRLKQALPLLPEPVAKPVLIVVSGLPGTGKSYFSRKLATRIPVLHLESDVLRKVLFPSPNYSASESARLFRACHLLIEELLRRGISVLLDATNLVEVHRERLYAIADHLGAKLILVRVEAPPEVVEQRLQGRAAGVDPEDHSSADWGVYHRMRRSVEPIRRNHFAVDTSQDLSPALERIVREVNRWLRS